MVHEIDYAGWGQSDALKLHRQDTWGAPGSGAGENKREAEASHKVTHHQSKVRSLMSGVLDLSKLTHRQSYVHS